MNLTDLLRMSLGNLKRRKLRTFLTVLGVIIGTASIVVMISLGLGMQNSIYQEVEQSGGLTTLTVTGKSSGDTMMGYDGQNSDEPTKYITDDTIKEFSQIEHVKLAAPMYQMSGYLLKGPYIGYIQIVGTTREALENQNIELRPGGSLPAENSGQLEFVFGNGLQTQFYEKNSGKGYWDTGEMPDVDLEKDQMFLVLNTQAYDNARSGSGFGSGDGGEQPGTRKAKPAQKYVVHSSGVVAGGPDSYNTHFYNAYCDIDTLKMMLKREFAGTAIPGQPQTKSGKPYKFFAYTSASVKVDDLDEVDAVSQQLRDMGYNVQSNVEYVESMKSQFAIIQAVLGGIGAVSLLVAAIGIANTMMMSIYERTKEIGVIKVLGCSLKNIKQMFLMEAAFIGFLGGVIGNIFSFAISGAINFIVGSSGESMGFAGNISYIPVWLMLVSMGFAVLVGMVAGYFPALRAMRLSPLAVIRNE